MKAVIAEENIKLYKHSVTTVCSAVDKGAANPIEQCVLLEFSDSQVSVTAVESGSHSLTLECDAVVQKTGRLYVQASTLLGMTKRLGTSSLTISVKGGNLVYTVPVLGSISEPSYHDQSGFSESALYNPNEEVDLVEILPSSSTLGSNVRMVSAFTQKDRSIRVVCDGEHMDLYGSYSETGSIRYRDPLGCLDDMDVYISPRVAKLLPAIGNDLSLYSGEGLLEFRSAMGKMRIATQSSDNSDYESMDLILSQDVSAKVEVGLSDLEAALQWQSYKAEAGQGLTIKMENDGLSISTGKVDSPSVVNLLSSEGSLEEVTLPLDSTHKALLSIKSGDRVSVEQRVLRVGGSPIKVVAIYPTKKANGYGVALINEQVMVK